MKNQTLLARQSGQNQSWLTQIFIANQPLHFAQYGNFWVKWVHAGLAIALVLLSMTGVWMSALKQKTTKPSFVVWSNQILMLSLVLAMGLYLFFASAGWVLSNWACVLWWFVVVIFLIAYMKQAEPFTFFLRVLTMAALLYGLAVMVHVLRTGHWHPSNWGLLTVALLLLGCKKYFQSLWLMKLSTKSFIEGNQNESVKHI